MTAVVVAGAVSAWGLAAQVDQRMREELLGQADLVAGAVRIEAVQALSGTETDLDSAGYERLKEQLVVARALNPECRFVYLLGQEEDGTVFFYLDSEAADSPDYSPPGEVYEDASVELLRALEAKTSLVEGPVADQWGRWVSALVPVTDPNTGDLLAVLGMDVDARAWRWDVVEKAVLPVGLAVLALIAVAVTGSVLFARRVHRDGSSTRRLRHLEPAVTVATGLVLTVFAAWLVYGEAARTQARSFHQLAASRTAILNEAFGDLSGLELEGLARLYENSDRVTEDEFQRYAGYLARDRAIEAWQWAPAVPASSTEGFEREARAEGMDGFQIWQRDAAGNREPAAGREIYYPVFRVTPKQDNLAAVGFDLGSEPVRRAAIDEAFRTGLATATETVRLVQETGDQKGMLVYRPVFSDSQRDDPRGLGLIIAVLRLDDTLAAMGPDGVVALELFLAGSGRPSELLASSWPEDADSKTPLTVSRPVSAFGKVFVAVARAGPEFVETRPAVAGLTAALAMVLLTAAVTVAVSLLVRRRQMLETVVRERTSALRESEERYRSILEMAPVGIAVQQKGEVVFANPAALRLIGAASAEEFVGRDIASLFHPDGLRAALDRSQRMVEGEEGLYPAEDRCVRLDGQVVDVEVMVSRLVYQGEPAIQVLMSDITERKRDAQKMARQLHDLQRWHSVMLHREERIMEIKREVNELLIRAGQPPRYRTAAEENGT